MKKRLLAMLLALVLVFSLLPGVAIAEGEEHVHCLCGATKTKGEHYEMYQAIVSGNAELAEELTTRHIMNAKKHMMEEMKFNG